MAEREGFEPSVGFPTHAFQACAIDHSATSPGGASVRLPGPKHEGQEEIDPAAPVNTGNGSAAILPMGHPVGTAPRARA